MNGKFEEGRKYCFWFEMIECEIIFKATKKVIWNGIMMLQLFISMGRKNFLQSFLGVTCKYIMKYYGIGLFVCYYFHAQFFSSNWYWTPTRLQCKEMKEWSILYGKLVI